jgi:hypothetical protein
MKSSKAVDGVTKQRYGKDLFQNIESLSQLKGSSNRSATPSWLYLRVRFERVNCIDFIEFSVEDK